MRKNSTRWSGPPIGTRLPPFDLTGVAARKHRRYRGVGRWCGAVGIGKSHRLAHQRCHARELLGVLSGQHVSAHGVDDQQSDDRVIGHEPDGRRSDVCMRAAILEPFDLVRGDHAGDAKAQIRFVPRHHRARKHPELGLHGRGCGHEQHHSDDDTDDDGGDFREARML